MKRNAFTLVEILVVIMIIAVLAGMLMPVVIGGIEQSHRTYCINNMRQIGTALRVYESLYKKSCPYGPMGVHTSTKAMGLFRGGEGVIPNPEVFMCPSAANDGQYGIAETALVGSEAVATSCTYLRDIAWDQIAKRPNAVIAGDYQYGTQAQPANPAATGNHAGEYSSFLFKDNHVTGSMRTLVTGSPAVSIFRDVPGAIDSAKDDMYAGNETSMTSDINRHAWLGFSD
mgnify:CR=1 FL=1